MAGMAGTKGKLLKALMKEKNKGSQNLKAVARVLDTCSPVVYIRERVSG